VSRKAEMWSLATSGSHLRFCSSEPKLISGWENADRLVRAEQRRQREAPRAGQRERAVVVDLREPEAAVLLGTFIRARHLLEAVEDVVGNLGVVLDLQRVDFSSRKSRRRSRNASPFSTAAGSRRGWGG